MYRQWWTHEARLDLWLTLRGRRSRPIAFLQLLRLPRRPSLLAHSYDHIEDSVVWGIVCNQIPEFIAELERIPGIDPD